jgi:hypothetical protein
MPALTAVTPAAASKVMPISAPVDGDFDQSTAAWEDWEEEVTPSFVFSTSSVGLFGRLAAGFGLAILLGIVGVLGFLVHSNSGAQLNAAVDRETVAAPLVAELKTAAVQIENETVEEVEPMMSAEPTLLPETDGVTASVRRDEKVIPAPAPPATSAVSTVKSTSTDRPEKKVVRTNAVARPADLVTAQVIPTRKNVSTAPKQTVRKKVTLDDLLNDN